MIHSHQFTVVLDACVLYPAPIRDLLLSLAAEGLFKPKWTYLIQDEWVRNLLNNRPDLTPAQLQKTVQAMNRAFPDAGIENFEDLIETLTLPDKDDRHVLASAIRCQADLITTFNLKDFPKEELGKYDVEVQHTDVFISRLIELDSEIACSAFRKMVARLKNPPKTKKEVAETLANNGLERLAEKLVLLC